MKRLLIMAAGTGGHIFPGIAVAQTMRGRGWEVSWLGTRHGMERDIVPKHGIAMESIDFAGLRGKGLMHTMRNVLKLPVAFATCARIIGRNKPDVVLGMGGYVTVPGGVMARSRGIPLALMNADAALLLSNKSLLPIAQRVMFGLPVASNPAGAKGMVTGNPVRREIIEVAPPAQRYAQRSGPLRILVVGGSLGARALNECLPQALARLAPAARPQVTHQSGKQHVEALRAAYAKAEVEAEVLDFIDDMPRRYAEADLVICRAGAITVSELTAAGVASVLVPLVVSTTSHQRDNAAWMAGQKAALHVPQQELTPEKLAALLQTTTRPWCQATAEAAYRLGQREAGEKIAGVLEELAGSDKNQ